jgi:hypothetical protein
MQIKVWLADLNNKYLLRYILPTIKFVGKEHPVYAEVLFSEFNYPVDVVDGIFLLRDPSGYPIEQLGGFVKFLAKLQHLGEKQLKLLQRYKYPDVQAMYLEAMSFNIFNKSWAAINNLSYLQNPETMTEEDKKRERKELSESSFPAQVAKAVTLPLGERLAFFDRLGYAGCLSYLLRSFTGFWDRSLIGYKRELFAPVASAFQKQNFLHEYELSGDIILDSSLLASYFR